MRKTRKTVGFNSQRGQEKSLTGLNDTRLFPFNYQLIDYVSSSWKRDNWLERWSNLLNCECLEEDGWGWFVYCLQYRNTNETGGVALEPIRWSVSLCSGAQVSDFHREQELLSVRYFGKKKMHRFKSLLNEITYKYTTFGFCWFWATESSPKAGSVYKYGNH